MTDEDRRGILTTCYYQLILGYKKFDKEIEGFGYTGCDFCEWAVHGYNKCRLIAKV